MDVIERVIINLLFIFCKYAIIDDHSIENIHHVIHCALWINDFIPQPDLIRILTTNCE